MTPITIALTDEVAHAAEQAGLLDPAAVEAMFLDRLSRQDAGAGPEPEGKAARAAPFAPVGGVEEARRSGTGPRWLPEALAELGALDEDIEEDGLPPIGPAARSAARDLLLAFREHAVAPIVYPTEDAEIAIYFRPPRVPASVTVRLENGGGATWSALVPGHDANGRCEDLAELPLGLLNRSLAALSGLSDSAG